MPEQNGDSIERGNGRTMTRLPLAADQTNGLHYPGQPPRDLDEPLPPRAASRPVAPALIGKAVGGFFGGLASLRRNRALHPHGIAFEARFDPVPDLDTGTQLFDEQMPFSAIVRISRGLGLPFGVPDWLGLAIRVIDAYGARAHQDLLLVSSRSEPLVRHALLPSTSFINTRFSSISPFQVGADRMVLSAIVEGERLQGLDDLAEFQSAALSGDIRMELQLATLTGPWVTAAAMAIDRQIPAADAEQLRFNPWNTGGSLRPAAPWDLLRDHAYRASQRGWPGPDEERIETSKGKRGS